MQQIIHLPILTDEILENLLVPFLLLPEDAPTHWWVDCTLGGGGHVAAVLKAFSEEPSLRKHRVLAVDQDPEAVERARGRFQSEIREGRMELHHGRFSDLEPLLRDRSVLAILADLGFSSDQLENPERGLSFLKDGPLDMRLNRSEGIPASEWLAQVSEAELIRVLFEFGEERFAKRIARSIVSARASGASPRTTQELTSCIIRGVPAGARHGRIHVSTRTFQALRIAVNQEMEELDALLERVILTLCRGGRAGLMSFHSLEDRKVKQAFRREGFRVITKKPMIASETEVLRNPRARSAKLRVAEREC